MPSPTAVDQVLVAAQHLTLKPRDQRWCHLSLCVLDAVFSINAQYGTTKRTVKSYAALGQLSPVLAPAAAVARGDYRDTEEPLTAFLDRTSTEDASRFADLLENRQLTSTRSGILKADASRRYAEVLVAHGVRILADVVTMLREPETTSQVEKALAQVPGHGSGVRVAYLWMLAGDDASVKPDRMVVRWTSRALGRQVDVHETRSLIVAAAPRLDVSPWVLDHAVWNAERSLRSSAR